MITMILLQPWAEEYAVKSAAKDHETDILQEKDFDIPAISKQEMIGVSFEAWLSFPRSLVAWVGRRRIVPDVRCAIMAAGEFLEDKLGGETLADIQLSTGGKIALAEIMLPE
jgi:hypothetical protein